jgi:hypothetical protein
MGGTVNTGTIMPAIHQYPYTGTLELNIIGPSFWNDVRAVSVQYEWDEAMFWGYYGA